MLLKIYVLICLSLIEISYQPILGAVPQNIQNLELDDVTSFWDKFPLFIDKIKEAVSRFRCPKGWKRLGGSCYYISNFTSTSSHANHTCHYLHSNLSNLMQIRNSVELLYAAYILTRNNLSTLMIEIDSSLLKGKQISDILTKDPGRWNRTKAAFREVRTKYQHLKRKIIDRLSTTGLRIFRRSKKIKDISNIPEPDDEDNQSYHYHDDEYFERELNMTFWNETHTDWTSEMNSDEYEYDELDSFDETDEFEQMETMHNICDDLHWNVFDSIPNTTTFILTKYNVSNRIICSLSDVEIHTKYPHVCEYVLDYCFANIFCGTHGRCVNTLAGFKCACSLLYGGLLCEKISEHGYHIIIGVIIIIILAMLSIRYVRIFLWFLIKKLIGICKRQRLLNEKNLETETELHEKNTQEQRRKTIIEEFADIMRNVKQYLTSTSNSLLSPVKRNLWRNVWVGSLSILFLFLLFVITTIMYCFSFGHYIFNEDEYFSINDTIRLVTECTDISDYRQTNVIFAPVACALIFLFSWSTKRDMLCLNTCDGRPGLIPPIEPFRTANRFTTATVFGILAFEVLKIFEDLLFNTGKPLEHAVLFELLKRIGLVIIVGLRYYPVLASLQLRNLVARLFACFYIIGNIIYTIVREGSCMGFLPLSGQYTVVEEAKLRIELGTWFIIYGLIKNIPHFFFLSYIGAELCVRFVYDSLYRPFRKSESIWSAPIVELDESEFAKYYVTKLFRRKHDRLHNRIVYQTKSKDLVDREHEMELQNKIGQSRIKKFIDFFYHSDDDFRFTTMAMCTYTVAVVFLYYLACTFVFLYMTRTTGHVSFLKFYFETTFNVDLAAFSFKTEIIVSAVLTGMIFACQLFIGMQNYKKHKIQLYQGIYYEIPSAKNFRPSTIASNSVHYSGFLVGYMAWGFVICFHIILLILMAIRVLSLQIRAIEIFLSIIVPILVIYFLKMLGMTSAGKFLFVPNVDKKLNLRSRKTYAIFVYFSFFADCFLGIASCIIRLFKATLLNVIFMARLDWSFLGRPLERYDSGFAAYVSYLHMEVAYTNPVMLAFCYSLYDDIVKQRDKPCYADECCIAPSELDSDIENPKRNETISTLTNAYQPTKNSSIEMKRQSKISQSDEHSSKSTSKQIANDFKPTVPCRDDISTDEDQNENKQLISTIKEIIPNSSKRKESVKSKTKTSETIDNKSDNTDDDTTRSSQHSKSTTSTTLGAFHQKKRSKGTMAHDTSLIEIEKINQRMSVYCPPSYDSITNPFDAQPLRTISYREAQHKTPPLTLHRLQIHSSLNNSNNPDDDCSHYSEITNDTSRSGVTNPTYSKVKSTENVSNSIDKQQISDNDTDVVTEVEEEETGEQNRLLETHSTAATTQLKSQSDELQQKIEKDRLQKRKKLRFRWHLLYTLIRNYRLFDLRKGIESRIALLHIQRSTIINEKQLIPANVIIEEQQTVEIPGELPEPTSQAKLQRIMSTQPENVPTSPSNANPSSPAERYIATRAHMLYNTSEQEPPTPNLVMASSPPTTTSTLGNQTRSGPVTGLSGQSLGFSVSTDITVQPSSTSSSKPQRKQTPSIATPTGFQQIPSSGQSTADYPFEGSSVANFGTYRTQMSLDQHLQVWRQSKIEKIQKKNRHCYAYDISSQPVTNDKISTATILTPQILFTATKQQQVPPTPTTGKVQRLPTQSPFKFPPSTAASTTTTTASDMSSKKTKTRKTKKTRPPQTAPEPPPRMDRVDEDPLEISNTQKSPTITTALIHRSDFPSTTTDNTET